MDGPEIGCAKQEYGGVIGPTDFWFVTNEWICGRLPKTTIISMSDENGRTDGRLAGIINFQMFPTYYDSFIHSPPYPFIGKQATFLVESIHWWPNKE